MRSPNGRTMLAVVLVGCVALVISTVAGAEGESSEAPARGPATAAEVDPELAARYGVLRRARGAEDRVPPFVAERMGRAVLPDGTRFDVDASLARRAATWGARSIYVVPGADKLCLESVSRDATGPAGGEVCSTEVQARTGYMISTVGLLGETGSERVEGLVPDGARVTLKLADGSRLSAPVKGNVFSVDLPQKLGSVSVTEANGAERTIAWSGS